MLPPTSINIKMLVYLLSFDQSQNITSANFRENIPVLCLVSEICNLRVLTAVMCEFISTLAIGTPQLYSSKVAIISTRFLGRISPI